NNFKSLKIEFDKYLSSRGPYEFQPFSDIKIFETHVRDKIKCLLLISSWHYNNIYRDYSLKPVLVGGRDGKFWQKRILVGGNNARSLKKGRLASASSIQHTKNVLREMLKEKEKAETANILTVPKDIDALMSVGFGMSQFALTTGNTLKKLKALNPYLYKDIKVLAESKKSLLLILAVPENFVKDSGKLIKIIQSMSKDPDGKDKLRMLGLDDWRKFDLSDVLILEKGSPGQ
ncbi:hypothetical protein QUF80_05640, partial [Desulfococcaceae bacterium HSG8]|nr:hypothetical protein [Desulfococcaceae bacterium HSG8]